MVLFRIALAVNMVFEKSLGGRSKRCGSQGNRHCSTEMAIAVSVATAIAIPRAAEMDVLAWPAPKWSKLLSQRFK